MSRIDKLLEMEGRLVVARDWGRGIVKWSFFLEVKKML